jgi:hypothetical protein
MSRKIPSKPAQARPLQQNLWMRRVVGASELLAAIAIDDTDQQKKPIEHRIDIQRTHYTSTGARYRVTYLGAVLIESAGDPEFEACRALLGRGITGTLVTYSPGSSVLRMRVDIEQGAKLTTIENAKDGPRTARYRPHPSSAQEEDPE